MSKRKKKHHHEEHVDESWLIPYADLLTLLLALFIVLFAMSSIDAVKFKQMARAFNSAFSGGTGVMDYPSPLPQEQSESLNKEDADNKENEEPELDKKELQEIQNKIENYIQSNKLQSQFKTTLTDEGLLVTILNDVLFDSGSADVRTQDQQIAREVSKLLVMDPPRDIIISGHTDNVPISNERYKSNWYLSIMRATNFLSILLENKKLDSKQFSAKGFGEYKPVASNATPDGRNKNRRVEILILPFGSNE